jgi:hypothetical protein
VLDRAVSAPILEQGPVPPIGPIEHWSGNLARGMTANRVIVAEFRDAVEVAFLRADYSLTLKERQQERDEDSPGRGNRLDRLAL